MKYIFLGVGKARDVFKEWAKFYLWGRPIETLEPVDFSRN